MSLEIVVEPPESRVELVDGARRLGAEPRHVARSQRVRLGQRLNISRCLRRSKDIGIIGIVVADDASDFAHGRRHRGRTTFEVLQVASDFVQMSANLPVSLAFPLPVFVELVVFADRGIEFLPIELARYGVPLLAGPGDVETVVNGGRLREAGTACGGPGRLRDGCRTDGGCRRFGGFWDGVTFDGVICDGPVRDGSADFSTATTLTGSGALAVGSDTLGSVVCLIGLVSLRGAAKGGATAAMLGFSGAFARFQ